MAVIAQQRHAIEQVLELTPEDTLKKTRTHLRGNQDWIDAHVTLVGISRGGGTNASTSHVVGVLSILQEGQQAVRGFQLRECDAIVLVRPASQDERDKSPLGNSALHVVEALSVTQLNDHDQEGGLCVLKLPFSSEYVAC